MARKSNQLPSSPLSSEPDDRQSPPLPLPDVQPDAVPNQHVEEEKQKDGDNMVVGDSEEEFDLAANKTSPARDETSPKHASFQIEVPQPTAIVKGKGKGKAPAKKKAKPKAKAKPRKPPAKGKGKGKEKQIEVYDSSDQDEPIEAVVAPVLGMQLTGDDEEEDELAIVVEDQKEAKVIPPEPPQEVEPPPPKPVKAAVVPKERPKKGLARVIEKNGLWGTLSPGLSSKVKIPRLHQNIKPPPPPKPALPKERVKPKKKGEEEYSDEELPWYKTKPSEEWDSDDQMEWRKVQRTMEQGGYSD